ncbi:MAG: DUF177 domain-containing protein [Thermomicrobiales bacterium]|nr:DUF177 domain-containing protein [Thermomicrobiales bacterium]
MSTQHPEPIQLDDDLIIKVSSLLMESIGSTRKVNVYLTRFSLDEDLTATDVSASIVLTRLNRGVLASGSATGSVELECVRCLNTYEQSFTVKFAEQFRQITEVLDGRGVTPPREEPEDDEGDDELAFEINDAHELDLTELLRQWILLSLPMTPVCGKDCPGPQAYGGNEEDVIDARFAALQDLLDTEGEQPS